MWEERTRIYTSNGAFSVIEPFGMPWNNDRPMSPASGRGCAFSGVRGRRPVYESLETHRPRECVGGVSDDAGRRVAHLEWEVAGGVSPTYGECAGMSEARRLLAWH